MKRHVVSFVTVLVVRRLGVWWVIRFDSSALRARRNGGRKLGEGNSVRLNRKFVSDTTVQRETDFREGSDYRHRHRMPNQVNTFKSFGRRTDDNCHGDVLGRNYLQRSDERSP